MIKGFKKHNENHEAKGTGFIWKPRNIDGVASTIRANASLCPTDNTINECIEVGNLNHYNYDEMNRVYSKEGCSPTLRTMQGGDRQPRVLEPIATVIEATKKGYAEIYEGDSVNFEQPNSKTRRGRVGKQVTQTLTTSCNQGIVEPINKLTHLEWKEQMYEQFIKDANGEPSGVITNQSQTFGYRPPMKGLSKCLRAEANDTGIVENFRVRKLTPNECWKLMGLTEEDCTNAKNIGVADSQLYKQAGNSLVTNCVSLLAEHLYKAQYNSDYICEDEKY